MGHIQLYRRMAQPNLINAIITTLKGETINMKRPDGYNLVFEDEFHGYTLDENSWLKQMDWGTLHFDKPSDYASPGSVSLSNGTLKLIQRYAPIEEYEERGQIVSTENAIGVISSKQSWKYGWFEASIKLPTGKGLWPAFWLTGAESWPPEIDIVEGYSKKTKGYSLFPFWFKRNLQTNFHYRDSDQEHTFVGALKHWTFRNPRKRFLEYACHWTEDFIRIYYEGRLVRELTDKSVLEQFDTPMTVVLNTATQEEYPSVQYSEMEVNYVRIYQKLTAV